MPPRKKKPKYRFTIGMKVECQTGKWSPGTVVALDYREDSWPPGKTVPYQIQMDDGRLIFAPADEDQCIRRAPEHIIHTLLEEQDAEGLQAHCVVKAQGFGGAAKKKQVKLLNARNSLGEPPITCLFLREKNVQWIFTAAELLQQGGADMGAQDKFGSTVLHHAARRGDMSLLDLALEYVAEGDKYCLDVNLQDMKKDEYANGDWVVVTEDKRYLTEEEKEELESDGVEVQHCTVSITF
jgi:hypothetical protein